MANKIKSVIIKLTPKANNLTDMDIAVFDASVPGKGVTNAKIEGSIGGTLVFSVVTNTSGQAIVVNLLPGTYHLLTEHLDYESNQLYVTII